MLNLLVNSVAAAEKQRGDELYGQFNSNHEAYAVLKEEIEELVDCIELYRPKKNLRDIWELVKIDADEEIGVELSDIHVRFEHICMESIQCLAMIKKWQEFLQDKR